MVKPFFLVIQAQTLAQYKYNSNLFSVGLVAKKQKSW